MSRAFIWKQDPSVLAVGIRLVFLPHPIEDGPRDSLIEVGGDLPVVLGDNSRDFLFDQKENPDQFDVVHTFVAIRMVVTMIERALIRAGNKKPFAWNWKDSRIKVFPRAGVAKNAYYSRSEQALKFFYFRNEQADKMVYTNRSFDVVAHEVGHAVLDALRPGYFSSWHPQTSALHEAFGDIIAILVMLSQLDQCEAIIAHSKADLHQKSFFNAVAEQFGEALYGNRQGLRNADNNLTLAEVSEQSPHSLSQVFTGAFYDILADIFDNQRNPRAHDDAEVLFRVGEHMTDLLLTAIMKGPEKDATFADIAKQMVSSESNSNWKKVIKKHFEVRLVLGSLRINPAKKPVEILYSKCNGFVSSKEHREAVEEAIKKKQSWFPFVTGSKPKTQPAQTF